MSSFLREGPAPGGAQSTAPAASPTPASPPGFPPPNTASPRSNNTLTVIAGVGVLLLAIGVGVLIGRSGTTKQVTTPPQVITVAEGASTGAVAPSTEASFTSDWPAGTSGYTVQLQTLAQTGTSVSAVEAAKTSASAKGAKSVGALKSEEFSSLTAGSYVIYSGVYNQRAEAEKALPALKKSFSAAKVIKVSNTGTSASAESPSSHGSSPASGGVGSNDNNPAPPTVLKSEQKASGKSYEEKSKNLPNVVETG
jgi:hypothetical protein